MSDNPIMNIGDLAKPATALIEKIADAGYILYEPRHIKKVAEAKVEAAKIQAESEIEITDLRRRAVVRWIEEEARNQKNIEDITTKAVHQLDEDADPHNIDDDWIVKFFEKSRLVSNDTMQDLWTGVLAGEANCAGSYSPKALMTLADMDQKVAALFNTFCSLCIVSLKDIHAFVKSPSNFEIADARVPIIRGILIDGATLPSGRLDQNLDDFAQKSKSIYQRYGLGLNEFQLLLEHGLLQDDTYSHYSHFWYNDGLYIPMNPSATTLSKLEDVQPIKLSGFRLSFVGTELFHITKRDNSPEYLEDLLDFLQEYYEVKISRVSNPT